MHFSPRNHAIFYTCVLGISLDSVPGINASRPLHSFSAMYKSGRP